MTHNVDATEIEKFSQLAEKWWDTTGEFKPLHDINPLRLDYINTTASLAGKNVLDVGCGGGILAESIAKTGAVNVLGIDMAEKSLKVAQHHADAQQLTNIHYQCISVEDLAAQQPHTFDVITCMEMLEHVPDPDSVVHACSKLVKPNGWVFFSTINRNAKAWLQAVCAAEYVLHLVPKGTHDWQKFITPAQLARMARAAQLDISDSIGFSYHLVTKKYFLRNDTSVNYMMACRAR